MDKQRKKWVITFVPIIFIVLFALVVISYYYEFDCKDDISCYNKHLENCEKAKLTVTEEGSSFEYKITGSKFNKCEVKVTVLEMPPQTDKNIALLFEGKSMTCLLEKGSDYNTELLPYCTGPLKESLYELIIQKFYNVLAQSLGDIISSI